jgi:hypothetical protein
VNYAAPMVLNILTSFSQVAPAGNTVVLFNTSTSNFAYTTIHASPAVATIAMDQIAPGGCFAYTQVGSQFIAGISVGGQATLNVSAGSGWPLGCGGGGSSGGASGNVFQATAFANNSASSSVTTEQFPASGTTVIYLINYAYQTDAASGAPGTFQLVSGTGVNCASSQVALTPVWNFSANNGIAEGSIGTLGASAPGAALCVKTTTNNLVKWRIGVAQQCAR